MKKFFTLSMLVLLPLLFLWALAGLFQLRFEQGDMYPAYSSLRSDPLGVKGWYEGLQRLEDLEVTRNLRPLEQLDGDRHTALVVAGWPASDAGEEGYVREAILDPVTRGARLILALTDNRYRQRERDQEAGRSCCSSEEEDPNEAEPNDVVDDPNEVYFPGELGYRLAGVRGDVNTVTTALRMDETPPGLAASMAWLGSLVVAEANDCWRVWYAVDEQPVIMERDWGQGCIILLTDSYLLSNEAQVYRRQPELLAALVGSTQRVVFEETHFGIAETTGLARLARQYRLHGFVGGLLVVALLLIWTLAHGYPVRSIPDDVTVVAGRDLNEGWRQLLQRSVPVQDLVPTCFQEWSRSHLHNAAARQRYTALAQRAQDHLNRTTPAKPDQSQCLQLYRELDAILNQRDSHE